MIDTAGQPFRYALVDPVLECLHWIDRDASGPIALPEQVTCFILAQLRVMEQAIGALKQYLKRKAHEVQETRALLRSSEALNHRQVALLSHAFANPHRIS